MRVTALGIIALGGLLAGAASAQNVPLYRVTVIERTVKAVNYNETGLNLSRAESVFRQI